MVRRNARVLLALNLLRSEEHTSELQSRLHLVCRLLLEKKKTSLLLLAVVARTLNSGLLYTLVAYFSLQLAHVVIDAYRLSVWRDRLRPHISVITAYSTS